MTANEKKNIVKVRVKMINSALNENYEIDYNANYGGWSMYKVNPQNGSTYRDLLGFDVRKSHDEMLAYLYGIMCYMHYVEVKGKEA